MINSTNYSLWKYVKLGFESTFDPLDAIPHIYTETEDIAIYQKEEKNWERNNSQT